MAKCFIPLPQEGGFMGLSREMSRKVTRDVASVHLTGKSGNRFLTQKEREAAAQRIRGVLNQKPKALGRVLKFNTSSQPTRKAKTWM